MERLKGYITSSANWSGARVTWTGKNCLPIVPAGLLQETRMKPIPSRPLGRTGIKLPALGFGGAPLGELFQRIEEDDAQEMLQAVWGCGIRYFDTAPWYGHGLSEHRIGHLLRQQDPTAFICSTKVGRVYTRFAGRAPESVTAPWTGGLPFVPRFDYTYDGIMRSYEDSLMRLGPERIRPLWSTTLTLDTTRPNECLG